MLTLFMDFLHKTIESVTSQDVIMHPNSSCMDDFQLVRFDKADKLQFTTSSLGSTLVPHAYWYQARLCW